MNLGNIFKKENLIITKMVKRIKDTFWYKFGVMTTVDAYYETLLCNMIDVLCNLFSSFQCLSQSGTRYFGSVS